MDEQSRWLNQLRLRPQSVDIHFDLGLRAYESGDAYVLARHRGAIGMLPEAGVDSQPFLALRWRELWLEGAQVDALQVAYLAYEAEPANIDNAIDLSSLLEELKKFPESLKVLLECARLNTDEPDIWYQVGGTADQLDNLELRYEAFKRVWELERTHEPVDRHWIAEDRLLSCVEGAIAQLPPMVSTLLGAVTYVFEDYPEAWILETELGDPRVVVALDASNDVEDSEDGVRAHLVFYRWNIERLGDCDDDVSQQVEAAVRDEIAFALGVDDDVLLYEGEG